MQKMLLTRDKKYNDDLILENTKNPYCEGEKQMNLSPVIKNTRVILLREHVRKQLFALLEEVNGWEEYVLL